MSNDTEDMDEIICSNCNYQFEESYNYFSDGDSEEYITCPKCKCKLCCEQNISVTYSTRLVEEPADA